MNRLVVSIIIIILTLASAVTSCAVLSKAVNRLEKGVSECMELCEKNETAAAIEKAKEISSISRSHSVLFNTFLNHNDFDELFTSLNMLPFYAENDIQQLYFTAAQCLCQLQYAHRYITPSCEMIF